LDTCKGQRKALAFLALVPAGRISCDYEFIES
jgi:hypothetical protein